MTPLAAVLAFLLAYLVLSEPSLWSESTRAVAGCLIAAMLWAYAREYWSARNDVDPQNPRKHQ